MQVFINITHAVGNNGTQQEAAKSRHWIYGQIHVPQRNSARGCDGPRVKNLKLG
jgi:hypothetical protein